MLHYINTFSFWYAGIEESVICGKICREQSAYFSRLYFCWVPVEFYGSCRFHRYVADMVVYNCTLTFLYLSFSSHKFMLIYYCRCLPFVASNGNPRLPDSLHYIDPSGRPNVYQKVSNWLITHLFLCSDDPQRLWACSDFVFFCYFFLEGNTGNWWCSTVLWPI